MHTNSIPTTEQFNGIIFVCRENIRHSILYFDKFSSRGGIATDRRSKRNQLNTIPTNQSYKVQSKCFILVFMLILFFFLVMKRTVFIWQEMQSWFAFDSISEGIEHIQCLISQKSWMLVIFLKEMVSIERWWESVWSHF